MGRSEPSEHGVTETEEDPALGESTLEGGDGATEGVIGHPVERQVLADDAARGETAPGE